MTTPTVRTPVPTVPSPRAERAAPSSPATAGWRAHSPAAVADAVWVPLVAGALILAAGVMSLATGQPLLFAGLGPTALLIASSPGHPTTRFHNVVVGHVVAFFCAWFAMLLFGVGASTSFLGGQSLSASRVWASVFAVAATALLQPSFRAYHPPAAATALLVTLGTYRVTWKTGGSLLAGVVAVALLGEWFQRARVAGSRSGAGSPRP